MFFLLFIVHELVAIVALMIHRVIKVHRMNHGDLEQSLIHNLVTIDGMINAMSIDGMTDEMTEETIIDVMNDEDSLHNKHNNHHHQHRNDGQKKILKQQAIGEQLKRNVRIRKL
jgi:hypothetical protein